MLAQVTYIQKFIMADSEDEFKTIFVAASAVKARFVVGTIVVAFSRCTPFFDRCGCFWNILGACVARGLLLRGLFRAWTCFSDHFGAVF